MTLHAWIWGIFFGGLLGSSEDNNDKNSEVSKNFFLTLFVGIVFIGVYAQLVNFFYRLDGIALFVLSIISFSFLFLKLSKFKDRLRHLWSAVQKQSWLFFVGMAVLCLIILGLSASSPSFYDTDLYHAQVVKWAENYPVVVGLGNVYSAFALNSSVFSLFALFSFHFVFNQSMHAISGLLVVWFLLFCYQQVFGRTTSKEPLTIFRIFTFFCLVFVTFNPLFTELVSSLFPDIIANVFGFLTMILFVKVCESKVLSPKLLFLILIFAISAITSKLSMGFIVFIPLLYIGFYVRNWRRFLLTSVLTCLLVGPYLLKTALLSGYLLYPLYWLDVLTVDWKMSTQVIYEEMMWIRSWNRVPGEKFDVVMSYSLGQWLPIWWSKLKIEDQIVISLLPLSLVAALLKGIFSSQKNRLQEQYSYLPMYVICLVGSGIWFITSPDPRFGYIFFVGLELLLIAVTFRTLITRFMLYLQRQKLVFLLPFYLLLAFVCVAAFFSRKVYKYRLETAYAKYLIMPSDYDRYEMNEKFANNIKYYVPVSGDRMGYEAPLPATPYGTNVFYLRGNDLSVGFRLTK